jgi:hypothetical protein
VGPTLSTSVNEPQDTGGWVLTAQALAAPLDVRLGARLEKRVG